MHQLILSLSLLFSSIILSFDEGAGTTTHLEGDQVQITPSCLWLPGVKGNAALFNGFTSRIVIPAKNAPAFKGSFTIDTWICPLSFPKSPCPIVCRLQKEETQGYSLYLDARGRVFFKVAAEGKWYTCTSKESIPLSRWSRITCSFTSSQDIKIAINGEEKDKAIVPLQAIACSDTLNLWIGRTPFRTPSEYEQKSIPIYSTLDAALDEFSLIEGSEPYQCILAQKFTEPQAPKFEKRILPSGPSAPLDFGSWYIPLKFYKQWDEQWRGETPDIVVGFGSQIPFRVVFWRGISYAPCFVTDKGNWMSNEFIERLKVTHYGCCENMSDKHADFSSVRILENTPARTVVLWRNAPVGVNQIFPYQQEESQWGDWSEETYIFYPDGVGVRKMDVWSSNLTDWYEWSQSLQVLHPFQRPEDVLDPRRIMSVANMLGQSETYAWDHSIKATQHQPTIPGANIQVTYLKSQWNPFIILDDRSGVNENGNQGPEIHRYAGSWSKFSKFPWRNHWPVVQDYVIGRYATTPDGPSHTYTATQYNAPYKVENGKMTKLMLCGCTDKDAAELLPLAKSWLRPASLRDSEGKSLTYDIAERAYKLTSTQIHNVLHLDASPKTPVCGLCLVVDSFPQSVKEPIIKVNGKSLKSTDYRIGRHLSYTGQKLIVWLNLKTDIPTELMFQLPKK